MFGFPVNLQDSGVVKFTNDADSGFPKIQQREIFYSVKNGLWSDISTWQTASGKVGIMPTRNDDIYIRHVVDVNISVETNNLFVSGEINRASGTGGGIFCFGNFKCVGTFNGNNALILHLFQNDNYINNFIPGTSKVVYAGNIDQDIMPLPYFILETGLFYNGVLYGRNPATGINATKRLKSNLVVTNLSIQYSRFDTFGYDLVVNGTTSYNGPGGGAEFVSTGQSNILFVGEFSIGSVGFAIGMDFSVGNPNIEFRGGIDLYRIQDGAIKMGTGTITFSTNNQTIRSSAGANGNITFNGNVILNNVNLIVDVNCVVNLNNPINATNGSNVLTNKGTINFLTAASVPSMTTGSVNFTTFANTIGYVGNYTATIPSYFPTFHGLIISGTGTKSLGVNTTLNGNLTSNGTFALSTFNLIVNGTSTLNNGTTTTYPLSKTGSGNIVFVGLVSSGNSTNFMDLSGGNPLVEMRGGMYSVNQDQTKYKSGTGTWTFTTNNQSIQILGSSMLYFDGAITIGAGLTLSATDAGGGGNNQNKQIVLNSTSGINGLSSTSQLIIGNLCGINIKLSGTTLMTTGIFNPGTNSGSMFEIGFNGNYTLPYTTFGDLRVVAGSGIKSLSGNTTINNFGFLTSANGQFQCSTFNLTINGGTEIYNNSASVGNYALLKSGSGSVLFTGLLTFANNSEYHIDFSGGNPSVELRGGILLWNIGTAPLKSGTGTWTFSTNNQAITQVNNTQSDSLKFDCPVLISGAITLSQVNQSYIPLGVTFQNTLNGNNANSTFLMGSVSTGSNTCRYNNATQPMATGILNTSTNLNTFIYGNANQDIKGGPTTGAKQVYRNLTLNGGGVKTLQGFVSVLNTYTLTAPATLANNGFTLTNP